jgi:glycosyltransferase involved in cell wall biosynthesis
MSKRGHQITLATLWSGGGERAQLSQFESEGIHVLAAPLRRGRAWWNSARTLVRPTPLQAMYCWQPRLFEQLEAMLRKEKFDLIHIEHLRGARYGTHLESGIPAVWDSVDCISYLFEQAAERSRSPFGRFMTRLELPRTRWYEAWLVGQFNRVLVTSDLDRRAFQDLLQEFEPPAPRSARNWKGSEKIQVLPNGVDLKYFNPTCEPRAPQTIVFTGKMSYHANVTAALYLVNEIMPRVWEKFPGARVQIIGQNPPRAIRELVIRQPELVSVSGYVKDLRPYLAQATLAAAPLLYGAGIQNKVLEAMAMETPVVATTRAVAALQVKHERELLVADDPQTFSEMVIRFLRNPAQRERLGKQGRSYVEMNHDWNQIAGQLEKIYQQVIREQDSAN